MLSPAGVTDRRACGGAVTEVPALAADYIDAHLWTRSALTQRDRRRLMSVAVSRTAPNPVVAHLVLHVFRCTDACSAWHEFVGLTTDELAAILREVVIDDGHLARVRAEHVCGARSGREDDQGGFTGLTRARDSVPAKADTEKAGISTFRIAR